MNSVLVAYSGGVDSTFLSKVAYDILGNKSVAVTAKSEVYPDKELREAKKLAKKMGVKHLVINNKILKKIEKNNVNRCYYCKKELFSKLKKIAKERRIDYVMDGSNYNDLNEFRPGLKALKELGIRSPLIEAELAKEDIKKLSKKMNLPTWSKASTTCLATRIPYGDKITKKKLKMIDDAENYIKNLGIKQLRVRHHGNMARIETAQEDFLLLLKNSNEITNKLKKLGFKYITLDLEGYRTGSLNYI